MHRDPLASPALTGSSISRCRSRDYPPGRVRLRGSRAFTCARGRHPSMAFQLPYKHTMPSRPQLKHQRQQGRSVDAGKAAPTAKRPLASIAILAVAEQLSPSKPILVSKWVGAQALTDQVGQPSRGSSATTCSPRVLERVKGWALRCSRPDCQCAVESPQTARRPGSGWSRSTRRLLRSIEHLDKYDCAFCAAQSTTVQA